MSLYEINAKEIRRNITAQKNIYKFRTFLYSISKDIRQHCFHISANYLHNEFSNNPDLTTTERDRLQQILQHWQWQEFETNGAQWWHILSMNHSHSISLMTLIRLWIDDIGEFDPENFETSTFGLS